MDSVTDAPPFIEPRPQPGGDGGGGVDYVTDAPPIFQPRPLPGLPEVDSFTSGPTLIELHLLLPGVLPPAVDSFTDAPPNVAPFLFPGVKPPPPNWDNLLWGVADIFVDVGGAASFSPANNTKGSTFAAAASNADNVDLANTNISNAGTITYSGPEANCLISGTHQAQGANTLLLVGVFYDYKGVGIEYYTAYYDVRVPISGAWSLPFTIPETPTPVVIRIYVDVVAAAMPAASSANIGGTITNLP